MEWKSRQWRTEFGSGVLFKYGVGVRRLKIGILISEMDMDWPTSKDGLFQKPKLSMGFLPQ